jgi:hypothetical protein
MKENRIKRYSLVTTQVLIKLTVKLTTTGHLLQSVELLYDRTIKLKGETPEEYLKMS